MYIVVLFMTMILLFLQYHQGYSKICSVDNTSDIVENAALNKSAFQISNYSHLQLGVASHAVDGDSNPQYVNGSCTHTEDKDKDPRLYRWWMVDLEREYRIVSLNITNRGDDVGSGKRLRDFDIFVSLNGTFEDNDHMTDEYLCMNVSGEMGNGETRTFTCQSRVFGQFVQIYMDTSDDPRPMHICEVTVQGYPAVCVEATTTQSVSHTSPTTALTVSENTSITAPPMCPCRWNASLSTSTNLTQEEMVELVKELKKELAVNKKETSMSKRKLISVGDERQSAATIGIIGVLALCVPVVLIVSIDLINLWSSKKPTKKRKNTK